MKQKKARKPGGGRKRTAGLSQSGPLTRLSGVWIDKDVLQYLQSLPNLSAFVREAINEKRSKENLKK